MEKTVMKALWSLLLIGAVGCSMREPAPKPAAPAPQRVAAAAPVKEPKDAEYAVRWDTTKGGPKKAEKVFEALELEGKKEKKLKVRYFAVSTPKPHPDYEAILRRRTGKKGMELTFKFRGQEPIAPPTCPLANPDKEKAEVDVTFTSPRETRRAFSYSCDVENAEKVPGDLDASPIGCKASMRRLEAVFGSGELKVEEWTIEDAHYIEVSFGAKNDETEAAAFGKQIVAKLVERGIRPLKDGMTTLTTSCTPKGE